MSISTDWIVKGINYLPVYAYPKAGILHILFICHCFYLALTSTALLIKTMKAPNITSKRLNHLKYLLAAIIIITIGTVDFLGNYGIPVYPIGYFTSTLFLFILATAIVKHQLMDIKVVIRKSLVYSLIIIAIAIFYFLSIYITERIVEKTFGYQSIFFSLFFATFIATLFIPIKNFLEKCFFRKQLGIIAEENELLRLEIIQTERLKATAALASNLAHEIKNPLTSLATFTEYLPKKAHDPHFIKQFEQVATKEIHRINSLVHDLLTFAKPSAPQIQKTNPVELLNQIIRLIEQRCSSQKITINTQFNNNSDIQADPNQLQQAFLNIILNAIDAMPNGGTLTIQTVDNNHNYVIKISDTGSGISHEDLKHIFDPFFTKKEKGTGLGLAITQGIIEKHGGRITVKSQLNEGTKFTIKL